MPKGSNNPFGIKALKGQPFVEVPTKEFLKGKWVTIPQRFRAYPTLAAAFAHHAELLALGKPYAKARALLPDAAAFCDALTGVYATDPNYGKILRSIIRRDNLTQYDQVDSRKLKP